MVKNLTRLFYYTGTSYLHALPDIDAFYPTDEITDSPKVEYVVNYTTPATYTLWIRGYADNADADAVNAGLDNDVMPVTGFAPETWDWASGFEELVIETSGVHTLTVWMAEDGFRLDRILLTTDTTFIPSGFGPAETEQQGTGGGPIVLLDRTIVYTYDNLYRLTHADYSTGELYEYDYDPVGNRLQQIINGNTTEYLYDAANRLEAVDGQSYTFDANGNLLATGVMTNTWDAANRLAQIANDKSQMANHYNGVGDRVGQTVGGNTSNFALDVVGLPEVIQTSEGNSYLHLPGVIVAESSTGEVRYLLSDGLGSVRQAVDEAGQVVNYREYDPYGNPIVNPKSEIVNPYGYTGEWWENDVGLLHLRARWYLPETGTFLSRDSLFDTLQYAYASNNPINRIDPSGYVDWNSCVMAQKYGEIVGRCKLEEGDWIWGIARDILDRRFNDPDAWNYQSERVNKYIGNYMEPYMWKLNPHLHPRGYPPMTDVGAWHCPACPSLNPTSKDFPPYGIIYLPGSWSLGGGGVSPTPPTGPDDPTPTGPVIIIEDPYIPIIGPEPPEPLSPPPGGIPEIIDAVIDSHRRSQGDDGIIFGSAGDLNLALPLVFLDLFGTKFNGECLPASGGTTGLEVVYDFKHQERGIFWYRGPNTNFGSLAYGSLLGYVGKTRGFAVQSTQYDPDGYGIGVGYYSGYSASGTFSGVLPPDLAGPGFLGSVIEAAPLNKDKMLNPTGVFATYYGLGGSVSAGLPANVDIAVTNYSLLLRSRYGLPFADRKSIPSRIVGARLMEQEIRMLGGQGPPIPGMQGPGQVLGSTYLLGRFINEAISELWDFAYRP